MDRRTFLKGSSAMVAAPLLTAIPFTADAYRLMPYQRAMFDMASGNDMTAIVLLRPKQHGKREIVKWVKNDNDPDLGLYKREPD